MNKVQKALKAAVEAMETCKSHRYEGREANVFSQWFDEKLIAKSLDECKAALSDIEKCEPVAEAIRERDRLGFAVVNVIGKLDEIIENTQEVEIDDFLHIAVPIDMWNELEAALEDMPKRADLYTSPQPRDWVGLTDKRIEEIAKLNGAWQLYSSLKIFDFVANINDELKQLNTKG